MRGAGDGSLERAPLRGVLPEPADEAGALAGAFARLLLARILRPDQARPAPPPLFGIGYPWGRLRT